MFVTEMPRIMCAEIPVDTKISRNYHCSVLTRRYTVWPNSALDACLDKVVSYQSVLSSNNYCIILVMDTSAVGLHGV